MPKTARTGDPNGKGLAPWPAFKSRSGSGPMVLGDTKEMPDAATLGFYDRLYEKQMAASK